MIKGYSISYTFFDSQLRKSNLLPKIRECLEMNVLRYQYAKHIIFYIRR